MNSIEFMNLESNFCSWTTWTISLFKCSRTVHERVLDLTQAMCTVVVRKTSCKDRNHPILRGVITPHQDFLQKSWFFSIFNQFFYGCCGETYARGRPETPNSYSLTSWPELIVVIHGEYIPPGTHTVNLFEGHAARVRYCPPRAAASSWSGITSLRSKPAARSSDELTIMATGASEASVSVDVCSLPCMMSTVTFDFAMVPRPSHGPFPWPGQPKTSLQL